MEDAMAQDQGDLVGEEMETMEIIEEEGSDMVVAMEVTIITTTMKMKKRPEMETNLTTVLTITTLIPYPG
jgi:hypothetical protein